MARGPGPALAPQGASARAFLGHEDCVRLLYWQEAVASCRWVLCVHPVGHYYGPQRLPYIGVFILGPCGQCAAAGEAALAAAERWSVLDSLTPCAHV